MEGSRLSAEDARAIASGFLHWQALYQESSGEAPPGFDVAAAFVRDVLRAAAAEAEAVAAAAYEAAARVEAAL